MNGTGTGKPELNAKIYSILSKNERKRIVSSSESEARHTRGRGLTGFNLHKVRFSVQCDAKYDLEVFR
jgi:hypothetical protein